MADVLPVTPVKSSKTAAVLTPPPTIVSKEALLATPSITSKETLLLTPPSTVSKGVPATKSKDVSEEISEKAAVVVTVKEVEASTSKSKSKSKEVTTAYLTPPASPTLPAKTVKDIPKAQPVAENVPKQPVAASLPRPPVIESAPRPPVLQETRRLTLSSTLITSRLSIEAWKCAGKAQHGRPCGWYSTLQSSYKRTEIRNLVNNLSLISITSPAFDSALRELAESYSCHHHNRGEPLNHRLRNWKSILIPVTEIRDKIHALLWDISKKCSECGTEIGGQKVQNCEKTSRLILDHKGSIEYYEYLLQVWDANSRCSSHSGRRNDVRITALLTSIKAIVPASTVSPSMSIAVESFWPSEQLTDKFESIYSWNGPGSREGPLEVLRSKAIETLTDKDFNYGIVYIYSVEGNPGLIKIGYTGRTLEIRQAEIEFGCNRRCKMIYHGKVPNAKRVEELCHADLHEDRVQVYCSGCLGNHNEWFYVTEDKARAVFDKWATWMESGPYEIRSLRSDEKGYLKDASKLRDMAAFKKDPMA